MAQKTHVTSGIDQNVKATAGRVNWLIITAKGATAGDRWTIRDGGVTGAVKLRGTIEVANGTWPVPLVFRQGDPGLPCVTDITFTHDGADNTIYATIGYE